MTWRWLWLLLVVGCATPQSSNDRTRAEALLDVAETTQDVATWAEEHPMTPRETTCQTPEECFPILFPHDDPVAAKAAWEEIASEQQRQPDPDEFAPWVQDFLIFVLGMMAGWVVSWGTRRP